MGRVLPPARPGARGLTCQSIPRPEGVSGPPAKRRARRKAEENVTRRRGDAEEKGSRRGAEAQRDTRRGGGLCLNFGAPSSPLCVFA